MKTTYFEVAPSMFVLRIAPVESFCYNSFLILDEHPVLIHTGRAKYFHELQKLIEILMPLDSLSYIAFSHFEADECGAIRNLVEVCPNVTPLVGAIGRASIEDISPNAPRCLEDNEMIPLGKYSLQMLETPHCPHGWDSCMFYEPHHKILFSSDLGAHPGSTVTISTDDISQQALHFQDEYRFLSEGFDFQRSLKKIMQKKIEILATQHGGIVKGNAVRSLFESFQVERPEAQRFKRKVVRCDEF